MSVAVLVSGALFRAPEQRTSSAGRRYVKATLRAAAADNTPTDFWDVLAFSETAGADLLRLGEGERVTVQGTLKCELLERDGKPPRIIRTVFVDHVLALRAPPKERKAKKEPAQPSGRPLEPVGIVPPAEAPPFNDDIPF